MPLPQFKNEAEFRETWISPLLSKLGYVLVSNVHGPSEQGRDFFFADYDAFEHRRFYALQAKLGNIGAGTKELDSLLDQVKRAFIVRLRFHKEADERHISAVYIMASGAISREAREYISEWCNKQSFGENVYYLDGSTLERLDKFAFQRFDRQLRTQLIGLLNECQYNSKIIDALLRLFQAKKTCFDRCRSLAVERLLSTPPPEDILSNALLEDAWKSIAVLNKLADYHLLPMSTTEQQWRERADIASTTWSINNRLRDAALKAIRILDSRYAVTVEIVE